ARGATPGPACSSRSRSARRRKISVPGHDAQPTPAATGRDGHLAKRAVTGAIRGVIANRVLDANRTGDIAPDLPQVRELAWKIRPSTGQSGNLAEHARIAVKVGLVIDADRVDRRARPARDLKHVNEAAPARVVPTVTQDHERLPLPRPG